MILNGLCHKIDAYLWLIFDPKSLKQPPTVTTFYAYLTVLHKKRTFEKLKSNMRKYEQRFIDLDTEYQS